MSEVWRFYDENAEAFARDRCRLIGEEAYLDRILTRIGRPRPAILDLGCGTGVPVAAYLIARGCAVTGVDAAPAMLARARARFPAAAWLQDDMRRLSLRRRFDTVVAWDSFFHLTQDEQRGMFAVFRDHVAPGGLLLFTSGPSEGVVMGELYGRALYHASLSAEDYRALLAGHGFSVLRHCVEDPTCGGHTVWLAESRR